MRKHPRYPVLMDAVITTADGRTMPAIVTDLSTGGAGIETRHDLAADLGRFTLVVTEPGFELRVECEARNVRASWRSTVIHAQSIGSDHARPVEDVLHHVQA